MENTTEHFTTSITTLLRNLSPDKIKPKKYTEKNIFFFGKRTPNGQYK